MAKEARPAVFACPAPTFRPMPFALAPAFPVGYLSRAGVPRVMIRENCKWRGICRGFRCSEGQGIPAPRNRKGERRRSMACGRELHNPTDIFASIAAHCESPCRAPARLRILVASQRLYGNPDERRRHAAPDEYRRSAEIDYEGWLKLWSDPVAYGHLVLQGVARQTRCGEQCARNRLTHKKGTN